MKRKNLGYSVLIFSFLALLVIFTAFPRVSFAQKKYWKIGTAGSGGTFYYVGSGIANVVTKYVKEVKLTPEATGGGTENLRRIYQGNMEMALITPSDLDIVRKDSTAKPDKISLLGAAHKSITHLVVRKDTGYKTAKDFYHKGVKVGIGEPGSAVQTSNKTAFAVFGLTINDVEAHPISQNECAEALKDGIIEGFFAGSGVPLPSVSNVTQSIDALVLPFTEEEVKGFQKYYPYYEGVLIPARTYRGQDKPVLSIGYSSLMMVRSDMDPDLVGKIIKTIYEHSEEIAQVHPAGKDYSVKNAFGSADYAYSLGYKFHPGTVKYLKEQNAWKPKYE